MVQAPNVPVIYAILACGINDNSKKRAFYCHLWCAAQPDRNTKGPDQLAQLITLGCHPTAHAN